MSEIDRLRDRIEELELILGADRSLSNRIRGALGVTRDQAKMLGLLISRNVVTHEAMYTVVYGARPDCDQPEPKILDIQICKLRRRLQLNAIAIKTEWGEGWSMSLQDRAKVRRLIAVDAGTETIPAFLSAHAAA